MATTQAASVGATRPSESLALMAFRRAAGTVPRKMTAEERERVNVAVEEASRRGLVREVRSLARL